MYIVQQLRNFIFCLLFSLFSFREELCHPQWSNYCCDVVNWLRELHNPSSFHSSLPSFLPFLHHLPSSFLPSVIPFRPYFHPLPFLPSFLIPSPFLSSSISSISASYLLPFHSYPPFSTDPTATDHRHSKFYNHVISAIINATVNETKDKRIRYKNSRVMLAIYVFLKTRPDTRLP